jgi:hypothetical protein
MDIFFTFQGMFGTAAAAAAAFSNNLNFFLFFLLKFNMICMFWIVLRCWCQKWFLKNEKTSLTCILTQKIIWKAPTTTLSNTLLDVKPISIPPSPCFYCIQFFTRVKMHVGIQIYPPQNGKIMSLLFF